jgi:hypothetical protein
MKAVFVLGLTLVIVGYATTCGGNCPGGCG